MAAALSVARSRSTPSGSASYCSVMPRKTPASTTDSVVASTLEAGRGAGRAADAGPTRRCAYSLLVGTASGTPDDDAVDAAGARPGGLGHALNVLEDGPNPKCTPQVTGNLILTSHAGLIILFALVLLYLSGLAFTPLRPVQLSASGSVRRDPP